ncbi:hypothetical protein KKG72_02655 [bacterium]|nr:hypothetical protein [bacterium]MBU1994267.1 hypothetical protein [bacterium]
MQKIKTLFLIFCLACGTINLYAYEAVIIPFVANSEYQDSEKDSALHGGFYSKLSDSKNSVELSYERLNLNYSTPKKMLLQDDVTFNYSHILSKNYTLNGGFHYIHTNERQSNKVQSYFLGLKYFNKNNFDIGADVCYSLYNSYSLAESILQLKPYFGFHFGENSSIMGHFYTKISYYLMHPKNTTTSLEHNYNSYEIDIQHSLGNFTNNLQAWSGKQLYAVKDSGFTLYNLNEEHNGGYSFSSKYRLSKKLGIKAAYVYEDFSEFGTNGSSTMSRYILSCEYNF